MTNDTKLIFVLMKYKTKTNSKGKAPIYGRVKCKYKFKSQVQAQ